MKNKRKVMVSFERLPEPIRQEVKKAFPDGFQESIKSITDHKGNTIHVLPYETKDSQYLIKMDNFKALITNYMADQNEDAIR